MADYYVLTGEERKLLQELLDKSRSGSNNRGFPLTQIDRTLGTYIAKPTETTGIPPREDDVPGRAACNIYRIILDGTGEPSLVQASDIELQYVYNISTSTISQDWVLVQQDRFGDWVACGGSPSDESSSSSSDLESDESGSGSVSDEGSGSEKSTAIVPATWSPTGFTALFTDESPQPMFNDRAKFLVTSGESYIDIDPKFVEACEHGSIWVIAGCEDDVTVGAKVIGQQIRIRLGPATAPVEITLFLSAVRKGFGDCKKWRFPSRTKADFDMNEAKLKRYGQ